MMVQKIIVWATRLLLLLTDFGKSLVKHHVVATDANAAQ